VEGHPSTSISSPKLLIAAQTPMIYPEVVVAALIVPASEEGTIVGTTQEQVRRQA
jgi:hypothetical protein